MASSSPSSGFGSVPDAVEGAISVSALRVGKCRCESVANLGAEDPIGCGGLPDRVGDTGSDWFMSASVRGEGSDVVSDDGIDAGKAGENTGSVLADAWMLTGTLRRRLATGFVVDDESTSSIVSGGPSVRDENEPLAKRKDEGRDEGSVPGSGEFEISGSG